jgi:dipeptidyl aminopeptidase/acylaminoacyl peptidase
MTLSFRHGLASLCLTLVVSATAAATTIPAAEFFRQPSFEQALLSPDDTMVAMTMKDGQDKLVLAVMASSGGTPRVIASQEAHDIIDVHWVNSHRLVYSVRNPSLAAGETHSGRGMFAVDIDGSHAVQLVSQTLSLENRHSLGMPLMEWNTYFLSTAYDNQTNDIYVIHGTDRQQTQFTEYRLYRLNTVTGNAVILSGPDHVNRWLLDENGVPRITSGHVDGVTTVNYNNPRTGQWEALTHFTLTSGEQFIPRLMTVDGRLFVLANNGRDTQGLYEYDLEKKRIAAEPVIGLKAYDYDGFLVLGPDQKTALGVQYETSEDITTWFDEGMQAIQKKIDAALPATINKLNIARKGQTNIVLVHSYSDVDPGFWQLYETASGKFTRLGVTLPGIDPAAMSAKTMVRYHARDGLEIPAYLTLPKNGGGKHVPMVVLVHGGPWERGGHMQWDPQVQFLASRGYAVLQPEFRGSTGFGDAYFKAGWKQWGLAMEDDLSDGARWAVAQGYADPQRICIAGASYGGYAALMGVLKDPATFHCGVDWAGVTDINLVYDVHWSDITNETKEYRLPLLVGDQSADAAQLTATSPLANAAAIRQPLLLAYGGADRRVPLIHGKRFYDAVKVGDPNVEWIEYSTEGHGWRLPATKVDFWTHVENFLRKNIGQL